MAPRSQVRTNDDDEFEKRCRKCGEWWPLEASFWRMNRGRLVSPCRACANEAAQLPALKPTKWTDELVQVMYATYQTGLTLQEVAVNFGTDKHYLGVLFKQRGLKTRNRREARPAHSGPKRTYSSAFVQILYQSYLTGLSANAVGELYRMDGGLVAYLFYRDKLPMRQRCEAVAAHNRKRRLSGVKHPWEVDDKMRFSEKE